jgi:hypothetical protein
MIVPAFGGDDQKALDKSGTAVYNAIIIKINH